MAIPDSAKYRILRIFADIERELFHVPQAESLYLLILGKDRILKARDLALHDLNSLSELYLIEGNRAKADSFLTSTHHEYLAPGVPCDSIEEGRFCSLFGEFELENNEFDSARIYLEHAEKLFRVVGTVPNNRVSIVISLELVKTLQRMGHLYYTTGEYEQAESYYNHAYDILWNLDLNKNHPLAAANLYGLAEIYDAEGNSVEAFRLYEQSLTLYKTIFPFGHPIIGRIDHAYTVLTASQDHWSGGSKAFQGFFRVLNEFYPYASYFHNEFRLMVINATEFYINSSCGFHESDSLQRVYSEFLSGDCDPGCEPSELNNKGVTLYHHCLENNFSGNCFTEPISIFNRAIELTEQSCGMADGRLITLYNNLGSIYDFGGNWKETRRCYQRAFEVVIHNYGHHYIQFHYILSQLSYAVEMLHENLHYQDLVQRSLWPTKGSN